MAERAVQAKSQIDGGIGFRQPVRKVYDVECEIHSRKAGKISGRQPRPLYLRLCDVESTRGNAAESERMCAYDQSAQPCTGSTTRIEEPDRACTGSPAGRLVSSPIRPRRSDPRKRAFRQRQMAAT